MDDTADSHGARILQSISDYHTNLRQKALRDPYSQYDPHSFAASIANPDFGGAVDDKSDGNRKSVRPSSKPVTGLKESVVGLRAHKTRLLTKFNALSKFGERG